MDKARKSFNKLKVLFALALILYRFDHLLLTIITTDINDYIFTIILFYLEDSKLHPITFHLITFHSLKINIFKVNYNIHEKEIFVIVCIFKE
jgi:hypothetical protein